MTSHAHELSPPGPLPDAICPGIEVLVHRRATELIAEQPQRRRIAALSGVGGVAVAAVCAVLVLVVGSPSGGGLLTARQAVAAVVQGLGGGGVLHWERRRDVVGAPEESETPTRLVEQTWTDLTGGDSRTVTTGPQGGPQTTWIENGEEWVALPDTPDRRLRVRRVPPTSGALVTVVEDLRQLLERADRGELEVADAGERNGVPLAVVTERGEGITRRVLLTRNETPEVVRIETTVESRNAPKPIVNTVMTKTWQILPRTPETLADVAIPTNAERVP